MLGFAAAAAPVLAACGGSPSSTTDISPSSPATATVPEAATIGAAFPSSGELQIDFTYQASGGGRVHSPYIAVWIEDEAGDLVQTVSLWFKSDESKYLRDLRRWNSKDSSSAVTTGATRIPGSFSVAWNGTNLDGTFVADGNYFVCIEAARENGPYQIIREPIVISEALAPTTLTPNGELTAASVELIA